MNKEDKDYFWLLSCRNRLSGSNRWVGDVLNVKHQKDAPTLFSVRHTCETVNYDCNGFLEKNRSICSRNLLHLVSRSDNPVFLTFLYMQGYDDSKRVDSSVLQLFLANTGSILSQCRDSRRRFVCCVRSNPSLKPDSFRSPLVFAQLQQQHMIATIGLRQAVPEFKLSFRQFANSYRGVAAVEGGRIKSSAHRSDLQLCVAVLRSPGLAAVQCGSSMVLFGSKELRVLAGLGAAARDVLVSCCQRVVRRYIGRRYREALCKTRELCQARKWEGADIETLDGAIEEAVGTFELQNQLIIHYHSQLFYFLFTFYSFLMFPARVVGPFPAPVLLRLLGHQSNAEAAVSHAV